MKSSLREMIFYFVLFCEIFSDSVEDIRDSDKRGDLFNLRNESLAFYDALANNKSSIDVLGNDKLRDLARVLVERVKANTSIDWTIKESVSKSPVSAR